MRPMLSLKGQLKRQRLGLCGLHLLVVIGSASISSCDGGVISGAKPVPPDAMSADGTLPGLSPIERAAPSYYSDEVFPDATALSKGRTRACELQELVLPGLYRTKRVTYGEDWGKATESWDEKDGVRTTRFSVVADHIEEIEFFADATTIREMLEAVPQVNSATDWQQPPGIGLAVRIYPDGHALLGFQGRDPGVSGIPVGSLGQVNRLVSLHAASYPKGREQDAGYTDITPGTLEIAFSDYLNNVYAGTATIRLIKLPGEQANVYRLMATDFDDGTLLFWTARAPDQP